MLLECFLERRREDVYYCVSDKEIKDLKHLVVGRGSYSADIKILSSLGLDDDMLINIHIGRYTSIGPGLNILADMDHDINAVYMGVIAEFAQGDSIYRSQQGLHRIVTLCYNLNVK